MRKTTLWLLPVFILLGTSAAKAQEDSGFVRPLATNADDLKGALPPINQPQAGWTPMVDFKTSDGTATVPPCSDPIVLATVKDGVLDAENSSFPPAMGPGPVTKVALATAWVHPTFSHSSICDMSVQTDMQGTGPEEWEFQPFASNGAVEVFFYDKNDQPDQGD